MAEMVSLISPDDVAEAATERPPAGLREVCHTQTLMIVRKQEAR